MSSVIFPLILGLAAAFTTYCGVACLRRWAESRNLLDLPNERSSHVSPTPRGGGLAIVLVALLGGFALSARMLPDSSFGIFLCYASGASLVAAISWLDDLRSLPTWLRLTVHLAAAGIVILGIGYWDGLALPLAGRLTLGGWGAALTAVWIVGLTNAYNFMDGIDGIAGSQALVAGMGWAVLGWVAGVELVAAVGWLVACSSLGFLLHNWSPARIFMGDVGSAFLGFTLAVLPIMFGGLESNAPGVPVVGLLLVWPFVFDAAFTFSRRLWKRENVFSAHRSHLYQRMAPSPSHHARVTLIYAGLALAGAGLARVWSTRVAQGEVSGLLAVPVLGFLLWMAAVGRERRVADAGGSRVGAPGRAGAS